MFAPFPPRLRAGLWLCERAERLPPESRLRRTLLALAAIVVACILLGVRPAHAEAQSDAVLLARSCISERGWRTETDDCAAIALVVQDRMERRGETFREAIHALAPRLHGGSLSRRRWLLDLDEDCHRPRGLDATWETPRGDLPSRRDACLATMAEARAILAGEDGLVCDERPEHWGSTADLARRRRAGFRWRDAVCPGAVFANHFGFLSRPGGH